MSGRTLRQAHPSQLLGKQRKTQADKSFMNVIQSKVPLMFIGPYIILIVE